MKELEIAEERSYTVVKANEIIQKARYDLNNVELKLLSYIFSKIKPTDTELQEYRISIKDFCLICGIGTDSGGNYEHIKATVKGLRDKSFWIIEPDGSELLIGWLNSVRIERGSGRVSVKLDPELQKYVIGLFNNFTQYELLSTLPMKSGYSIRIYELLKSYANLKYHVFDLDQLKKQLGAETYTRFPDFRRKVIEIAVKEINLYTDLEVSWEPIKKGRKGVAVKFMIKQRNAWGKQLSRFEALQALDGTRKIGDTTSARDQKDNT